MNEKEDAKRGGGARKVRQGEQHLLPAGAGGQDLEVSTLRSAGSSAHPEEQPSCHLKPWTLYLLREVGACLPHCESGQGGRGGGGLSKSVLHRRLCQHTNAHFTGGNV